MSDKDLQLQATTPDGDWCGPLASQLATLRAWRAGVNVLAITAGLVLAGGVIAWLAAAPI